MRKVVGHKEEVHAELEVGTEQFAKLVVEVPQEGVGQTHLDSFEEDIRAKFVEEFAERGLATVEAPKVVVGGVRVDNFPWADLPIDRGRLGLCKKGRDFEVFDQGNRSKGVDVGMRRYWVICFGLGHTVGNLLGVEAFILVPEGIGAGIPFVTDRVELGGNSLQVVLRDGLEVRDAMGHRL
uniref:Uncharacterized protein n=1 Tax=viral metagenome TaxID=1070528 RepID=A0A2V0RB56_9ZZZZ